MLLSTLGLEQQDSWIEHGLTRIYLLFPHTSPRRLSTMVEVLLSSNTLPSRVDMEVTLNKVATPSREATSKEE